MEQEPGYKAEEMPETEAPLFEQSGETDVQEFGEQPIDATTEEHNDKPEEQEAESSAIEYEVSYRCESTETWQFTIDATNEGDGIFTSTVAPHGGPDPESDEFNPDVVHPFNLEAGESDSLTVGELPRDIAWYEWATEDELVEELRDETVDYTGCETAEPKPDKEPEAELGPLPMSVSIGCVTEDTWEFTIDAGWAGEGTFESIVAPHGGPDPESDEFNPDVVHPLNLEPGETGSVTVTDLPEVAHYEWTTDDEVLLSLQGSQVDFSACAPEQVVEEEKEEETIAETKEPEELPETGMHAAPEIAALGFVALAAGSYLVYRGRKHA